MLNICKVFVKPFMKAFALIGVGCVLLIKNMILTFKIKSQYKNIAKLNFAIQKLSRAIFNPYRISNGFRPACMKHHINSLPDIERCHELASSARLAKSN